MRKLGVNFAKTCLNLRKLPNGSNGLRMANCELTHGLHKVYAWFSNGLRKVFA